MSKFFIKIINTVLVLFFFVEQSNACPEQFKKLSTVHLGSWTLCQVYDTFQQSKLQLEQKGITDTSRIADWRGPRFINYPSWNKLAKFSGYNPWYIYKPVPKTWQSWENGHNFENAAVLSNIQNNKIEPITIKWIQDLHRISMHDFFVTAGSIRTSDEVGLQLDRAYAISEVQIKNINEGAGYRSITNPEKILLKWVPTICWDEQNSYTLQRIEKRKANNESWFIREEWTYLTRDPFFEDQGQKKQCGFIEYPKAEELQTELENWLTALNAELSQWGTSSVDILETVAHAQRLFIAIHPFRDGNGRASRHIMELLLESLGLPAPILKNMDDDMFVSEAQWADEIGNGIFRSLAVLSKCSQNPKAESCKLVPTSYEAIDSQLTVPYLKREFEFLTPAEVRP